MTVGNDQFAGGLWYHSNTKHYHYCCTNYTRNHPKDTRCTTTPTQTTQETTQEAQMPLPLLPKRHKKPPKRYQMPLPLLPKRHKKPPKRYQMPLLLLPKRHKKPLKSTKYDYYRYPKHSSYLTEKYRLPLLTQSHKKIRRKYQISPPPPQSKQHQIPSVLLFQHAKYQIPPLLSLQQLCLSWNGRPGSSGVNVVALVTMDFVNDKDNATVNSMMLVKE